MTPGGTLTTLYAFCSQANCSDGQEPGAGLIQASDGNFYGTTSLGGIFPNDALSGAPNGYGTVFKITPGGALTTLYRFCSMGGSCADGEDPSGALIQASDGNFYGITLGGGANARPYGGTVFKITPGGTLTTLYSFCALANCADGNSPYAGLIQASDGNFYGTTSGGGAHGYGTVFRITPGGTLTTVDSFDGADGASPLAGLIQASDGNLYGTTYEGGAYGSGTVFKLTLAPASSSPAINQSGGVVSGASFQAGIVAGSWITIFGTNLAQAIDTWVNAIVDGILPILLDGVSVSVGGKPAYIYYVSPTQIDALAPEVGTGTVPVTVTNSKGTASAVTATAQAAQPAFFLWPGNYAVATTTNYSPVAANGTLSGVTTTPAKPGDVIVLWGTGFGPTNPTAPAGFVTPSTTIYNTASPVTVTVGGVPATVYGAALAPGEAGVYQVAIQIPTSLANGNYPVIATISGVQSPSTTLITVQN
jgi:uncharacterized protein (TIGR03437 family)